MHPVSFSFFKEALRRFRKQLKRVPAPTPATSDGSSSKSKKKGGGISPSALPLQMPPLDPAFDPQDENYYRHFVPAPFPFD